MAIIITDECINCGACEPECPNNAIYEAGAEWKMADGTSLKGTVTTTLGQTLEINDLGNFNDGINNSKAKCCIG